MINDPCNDGYEESERVRILGESYRNAETYRAMRNAEKMYREVFYMKVSAFILFASIASIIIILVIYL